MQRGREVDPRHLRAIGLVLLARHIDGARHDLADAVEADAVAIGAAATVCGHGCQDDVGLDGFQALVIEPHRRKRLRGQIRDHDVCRRDELAHDLLGFRPHRVERHAALVAVDLQKQCAVAGRGNGRLETVLAALALFDADHLGAMLGEQRGAIRPGDVAPEVEHPDALEHASHSVLPSLGRARGARTRKSIPMGCGWPLRASRNDAGYRSWRTSLRSIGPRCRVFRIRGA